MKLGIVARCDNTGLGYQTKELVKMLKPTKILLIDSSFFNKNKQNLEWYQDYDPIVTRLGYPKRGEIRSFLEGLDVIFSCETFYGSALIDAARDMGIKTVLQYNYEFLVNIENPDQTIPDVFIAPSLWNIDRIKKAFGDVSKIVHIPPPTDPVTFEAARELNLSKVHNRILHVGGKMAARDRNGTATVLEMLRYSSEDYDLVITSQTEMEGGPRDARVKVRQGNIKNREDLYLGFDAMILPRRYAGLCLPMNEALISAMPVFMTNISPNNTVLPDRWLCDAEKVGQFRAKSVIDFYGGNPKDLARIIDHYVGLPKQEKTNIKLQALEIGMNNFSIDAVKNKYLELFDSLK